MKKNVVIGFLGTRLDNLGKSAKRWNKWRPTISLFQHPQFKVDRLELFREENYERLAANIEKDILSLHQNVQIGQHTLNISNPWNLEEVYAALLDWSSHYNFKPEKENYYIHISTGTHIAQICMFLLTEARFLPGKLIQTAPAKEEGSPPHHTVVDLDLTQYEKIQTRFGYQKSGSLDFLKAGIATKNPAFNKLMEELEKVCTRSKAPLLLTGPTGSGKTRLARRIFELKKERHLVDGEFVEMNCAVLRDSTVASTLFGHVKGAFTGAISARAGLLKRADKGVLFLDEIGELGLDEQAMLLRAIEDKTFLPVGADKEEYSDFQLIAGTHQDLPKLIAKGLFREDLYARINLWHFQLPGLKDRPEDFEPNVHFELKRLSTEIFKSIKFSTEAYQHFKTYGQTRAQWKGNFRDLSSAMTRMATLCDRLEISKTEVEEEIQRLENSWHSDKAQEGSNFYLCQINLGINYSLYDSFDLAQLEEVLKVCLRASNMAEAGRMLFSESRKSRTTTNDSDRVKKYLEKFDLSFKDLKAK